MLCSLWFRVLSTHLNTDDILGYEFPGIETQNALSETHSQDCKYSYWDYNSLLINENNFLEMIVFDAK